MQKAIIPERPQLPKRLNGKGAEYTFRSFDGFPIDDDFKSDKIEILLDTVTEEERFANPIITYHVLILEDDYPTYRYFFEPRRNGAIYVHGPNFESREGHDGRDYIGELYFEVDDDNNVDVKFDGNYIAGGGNGQYEARQERHADDEQAFLTAAFSDFMVGLCDKIEFNQNWMGYKAFVK